MDLAESLDQLSKANDGLTDEELKAAYLSGLEDGQMPDLLAKNLGKTGRWFRKFRSENSQSFDADFKTRYEEIMRPDGIHREALVTQMREALVTAGLEGNVRAIEKYLAAYDADFSWLRPAAFTGDTYNVDKLIQILPGVSTHVLEQMRAELVKQKELPVIEA